MAGIDYSVKSDKPLHGANYIHIASSSGTSRILRRVDTSYYIDYHTYLLRFGIEERSKMDRVMLDQLRGSYIDGVILDNPQDMADSDEESFEFIQIPHETDPKKFYYVLNLYLKNDEHTVSLFEIPSGEPERVTTDEPIFRCVIEDYSPGARKELKSYKILRIHSANFENDENIIDYHKILQSLPIPKQGEDEIIQGEVVSSYDFQEMVPRATHLKATEKGFWDKRNLIKMTESAKPFNPNRSNNKYKWGVNYKRGQKLKLGDLELTSLIHNNFYHPLQIGGAYEIRNKQ